MGGGEKTSYIELPTKEKTSLLFLGLAGNLLQKAKYAVFWTSRETFWRINCEKIINKDFFLKNQQFRIVYTKFVIFFLQADLSSKLEVEPTCLVALLLFFLFMAAAAASPR